MGAGPLQTNFQVKESKFRCDHTENSYSKCNDAIRFPHSQPLPVQLSFKTKNTPPPSFTKPEASADSLISTLWRRSNLNDVFSSTR